MSQSAKEEFKPKVQNYFNFVTVLSQSAKEEFKLIFSVSTLQFTNSSQSAKEEFKLSDVAVFGGLRYSHNLPKRNLNSLALKRRYSFTLLVTICQRGI